MIGQMSDQRVNVYEDFTDALATGDIKSAESLLYSASLHAGETAWEDTVLKMNDEWDLWLEGKSEYNTDEGCGRDLIDTTEDL